MTAYFYVELQTSKRHVLTGTDIKAIYKSVFKLVKNVQN